MILIEHFCILVELLSVVAIITKEQWPLYIADVDCCNVKSQC